MPCITMNCCAFACIMLMLETKTDDQKNRGA